FSLSGPVQVFGVKHLRIPGLSSCHNPPQSKSRRGPAEKTGLCCPYQTRFPASNHRMRKFRKYTLGPKSLARKDYPHMAAVQLESVTKTFGKHVAVDDLSLEVPEGTVYGFIGPNGSGKTTTLRMIMRIIHPDRGRISVLGEETFDAASDRVGYLPEERGL